MKKSILVTLIILMAGLCFAAEPAVVDRNQAGKTMGYTALTVTSKGSVGSASNPFYVMPGSINPGSAVYFNYAIPFKVTPLAFGAAGSLTITPTTGKSLFIEGIVLYRAYGSGFFMSNSFDGFVRSFDSLAIGVYPMKIVYAANKTVSFYSTVTNTATDVFGDIWYREE